MMNKRWIAAGTLVLALVLTSCEWWPRTVSGNGNMRTETRSVAGFSEVAVGGPFEVEITPNADFGLIIEADENLLNYIHVDKEGDRLKVKVRNGVNLRSKKGIKLRIALPELTAVSFAGSGNMKVNGVVQTNDKLKIDIAGSGNVTAEVDCPEVDADITGSGTIQLTGRTRSVDLSIAGSGDYKAEQLLSENTKVSVAGSGSAWVYASAVLEASIAGSGDVYYRGNPADVKRNIAGSGEVQPLQ